MIPLAVPCLSGNEARYLNECITSTFVSSVGPFVDRLEAMTAQASGSLGATATSSGTSGLHAALTAIGVGRDDLVILPTFTFIASANAIAQCGAEPWLFDIDPDSWTLDPGQVAQALRTRTKRREDGALIHVPSGRRVAAMMPVHTLGQPADMDSLCALAAEYGLPVVADSAAALGATYKGRPMGSLGADLSVFSFNGNKTVTAGGGGAVVSNNPDLLKLVRHLTTTARVGREYDHDRVGFNYRMTNLQAAVGCAQMEQLDAFVAAKRRIRAVYAQALADLPTPPFAMPDWADGACWFSGLIAADADTAQALRHSLTEAGIEARSFWKPMHGQAPFRQSPCEATPIADQLHGRLVTLPCSVHLGDADQQSVIAAIRRHFGAPT